MENIKIDFKSNSLKNSQPIKVNKLSQNNIEYNDDESVKPPSGNIISRENLI